MGLGKSKENRGAIYSNKKMCSNSPEFFLRPPIFLPTWKLLKVLREVLGFAPKG